MPTAMQIDKACRLGFFVYVGNRQGIYGAMPANMLPRGTMADPDAEFLRMASEQDAANKAGKTDQVWVHMMSSWRWELVDEASVIITSETMKEDNDMLKGKRGPKPGNRKPSAREKKEAAEKAATKKAAKLLKSGKTEEVNEERSGQMRIPGSPKKINSAIEKQSMVVYELQSARMEAAKAEQDARKVLTKMMVDAKIEEQDLDDDLIVELEREPKAKVHKKKGSKKAAGEQGEEGEEDDEED